MAENRLKNRQQQKDGTSGGPVLRFTRSGQEKITTAYPKHREDPFPLLQKIWDKLEAL